MKTFRIIALVLCASFMLTACGGGTPESVAEGYVKAYIDVDYKKAASYATKEYSGEIMEIAELIKSDEMKEIVEGRKNELKGIKYKVTDIDVDEEIGEATVRFEFTLKDERTEEGRVDLIKEDGAWKVENERIHF